MDFDIEWDKIDSATSSKLKTAQFHGCLREAHSHERITCDCGYNGPANIVIDHENWEYSPTDRIYPLCPNCKTLTD